MGILEQLNQKNIDYVRAGEHEKPEGVAPAEKPWDIRMTSVPADGKEPLLKLTTRHAYIQSYLPFWKQALRFRSYSLVMAAIGLLTLTSMPIVGIAALFGASYYHMLGEFGKMQVTSSRKVMWAQ